LRYYEEPDTQTGISCMRVLGQSINLGQDLKGSIEPQFKGLEIRVDGEIPKPILERFRSYGNVEYFGRVDRGKAE